MTPEVVMITVSIAKLGQPIKDVKIPTGGTAKDALKEAGFNLDSILSIKRNGSVITLDTVLEDGNVLLVSQEKIKGGNEEPETIVRVKLEIVKEGSSNGFLAFSSKDETFSIIRNYVLERGESMNNFKRLEDENGVTVSLADKLVDGKSYKVIMEKSTKVEDEDDEEYDD